MHSPSAQVLNSMYPAAKRCTKGASAPLISNTGVGSIWAVRLPLKKHLFPVQQPVDNICAEWNIYFVILDFFFSPKFLFFLQKKIKQSQIKKEFAAA